MKEVITCVNISAGHIAAWRTLSILPAEKCHQSHLETGFGQSAASVFSLVSCKLWCHLLMAWHRQEFTRTQKAHWT